MEELPIKKWLLFLFMIFFIIAFWQSASASIILKLMATNPSESRTRNVPVKVYLPKEVKPEDIIDKGDLKVAYDSQQGSYYVYNTYEIEPLGVVEREIELRDIWVIEESELLSIKLEAKKIQEILKNSEFADRVDFLIDSVMEKIEEIESRQRSAHPNPEEHISSYRNNLKLLEAAKSDLAVARSMLGKEKRFSKEAVWKLIIFIVVFLGVLSSSFYFIWRKQVNLLVGKKEAQARPSEELPKQEEEQKKNPAAHEQDIEKMLGGE